MSLKKQITYIALVTIAISYIVIHVGWQQRNRLLSDTIDDFQNIQLSFITQVSHKVKFSFAKLSDDLYSLSQIPEVQFLNKNTCLLNMMRVQKLDSEQIESIYRSDSKGIVRYGFPKADCPVTGEQLKAIFEYCRLTGKSKYQVIRKRNNGSDYLVIAQPVYTLQGDAHLNPSNKFSGLIFFVTTLDRLQSYFFSSSSFGDKGYPWIITSEKLLISTANTGHLGKRFGEFLPLELPVEEHHFIDDILQKMTTGESGVGRYTYSLHRDVQDKYVKLVAYTPLHLPNQRWSIAVSNLLPDVLQTFNQRMHGIFIYSIALIALFGGMALLTIVLLQKNHRHQLLTLQRKDDENYIIRKEWQLTFDNIDTMMFLLDRNLNILRANRSVEMLQKGAAGSLVGQSIQTFFADITDEFPVITSDDLLASGSVFSSKILLHSPRKTVLMTVIPIREKPGFDVDLICYLKDITAFEHLQDQYHRAHKMETIGLMAGAVAHDLNNILSGIVSYPELLLMKLPDESDLRAPIEMIQTSGKRAAAVVDDLLTVARGVASVKSVENINTIATCYMQSPEFIEIQKTHPEVKFSFSLDPQELIIFCSTVHIQKCIMNLVSNGAESIDGAGEVTLSTKRTSCIDDDKKRPTSQTDSYIVLTVSDSGSGILPEDVKRIFEPFYTKKEMGKSSGTGLGLAVVWNTMEDHNGTVKVVTDELGCHFSLYFKKSLEKKQLSLDKFEYEEFLGNGQSVLIIDDEQLQRDIATQLLVFLGYKVSSVKSGEEAIVFLHNTNVNIVLLDMQMEPGINGYQTYKKIKQIKPDQKAIITSGYSEDVHVKKTIKLGAEALIKKPYSIEQIGRVLKKTLSISSRT